MSVGGNWEFELLIIYPAHEFLIHMSSPQFELDLIVEKSSLSEFYHMQSRNGVFLFLI